ncbi:Endo-1,4-beta-xylanase A precursor [compost metagenome]
MNAQLSVKDLEQAIKSSNNQTLIIEVAAKQGEAQNINLSIPVSPLQDASANIKEVLLQAGGVTLKLDNDKLQDALSGAKGQLEFSLSITPAQGTASTSEIQSALNGKTAYQFEISLDGKKLANSEAAQMSTILLPYALSNGEMAHQVVVYHITSEGKLELVKKAKYDANNGVVAFTPNQEGAYVALNVPISFNDLGKAEWARNVIESLASREIVKGTGEGLFNPNQAITRAQFVHMLISALDLKGTNNGSDFTDIPQDSWYVASVSIAKQLGIVTGRSDGKFDGNATITREEMAVLVYRAAMAAKLLDDVAIGKTGFTDEAAFSGYAKDAIHSMNDKGIIQGVGNGQFQPKGLATRAQAAKVIYEILNL